MKNILYFIVVGLGLLAACKKGTLVENTAYEKLEYADPKYAYLKILNVTPGSPVTNFYIDGAKFSAQYSTLGIENAGYAYNGLFPDLGYAVTSPRAHVLTAKVIPTATADANLEVFNQSISPMAGKYYTLFTTGVYTAVDKRIPSVLIVEDIKPTLDTSKIFVRVVNLYNGSANLDFVRDSPTGTKIVSNVAYGTATNFTEIPGVIGGPTNAIKVYLNLATTTTTLISAGSTLTFVKGRAYTIYTRGILGNVLFPLTATIYSTFY